MSSPQTDVERPALSKYMVNDQTKSNRGLLHLLWQFLASWWLRTLYKAAVIVGTVALCIYMVGWAQRNGWIQVEQVATTDAAAQTAASDSKYICPMMCVPPTTEPGRCPVCAMELVAATSDGGSGGDKSVSIATADRRLVGIKTVAARRVANTRKISAVGVLEVDESRLARIPADSAGRVEKLFFNFKGQQIKAGERLATYYSPDLYAAQTELLTLKQTRRPSSGRRYSLANVREEIIGAARQRLREMGMTREQIAAIEQAGTAQSRIDIRSPQSGTITKLMLREGQYLKAGELVCEVADLSNIWLVTQLFPEDAAVVRYGQRVTARISSLPGQTVEGRISFVAPMVDSTRRAVNVRIDLENPDDQLRPGDEATVEIDVPLQPGQLVFDETLAGKFICPQHPDVIDSTATTCEKSGRKLIATEKYGFAAAESDVERPLAIPRSAVLMAGNQSAVYVEVEEGEYEIRLVTLGSKIGEDIVVLSGVEEAEQVATDGNFLIDSQMQLSGKPSLIDPSRAATPEEEESPFEIEMPEFGDIEMVEDVAGESNEGEELPSLTIESFDDGELPDNGGESEAEATEIESDEEWELPEFGPPELLEDKQAKFAVPPSGGICERQGVSRRFVVPELPAASALPLTGSRSVRLKPVLQTRRLA